MSDLAGLKATLKRGALVTAANWPVVVIQFIAESTLKLLVAVPLVGGGLLVALIMDRDLGDALSGEARDIAAAVGGTLYERPGAFIAFVIAVGIVLVGGSALTFLVKAGTVVVMAAGEAAAGTVERPPLRLAAVRRAEAFSVERFTAGARHYFRRYLRLGLLLLGVYALSGGFYLAVVLGGYSLVTGAGLVVGWTVVAALASSALIVWITIVNLVYLLLQMIVVAEDCGVRVAANHALRFARSRTRDLAALFGIVFAIVIIATVASVIAAAAIGLISFVPFVGLAVVPLHIVGGLVRGLVLQYLGLGALGAYLALYRASRQPVLVSPALVRTAS